MTAIIFRHQQPNAPDLHSGAIGLTKMERRVAEMVAQGRTNLEIAVDLNITERTVNAHPTSVCEKPKTTNRLSPAALINRG